MKAALRNLAPILCYFFDNAFMLVVFSQGCKIAEVVPLFKLGSTENLKLLSYMHINLLFKNVRKVIYTRFFIFFQKLSVFIKTQSEFPSNKFTTHTVSEVITAVYDQMC